MRTFIFIILLGFCIPLVTFFIGENMGIKRMDKFFFIGVLSSLNVAIIFLFHDKKISDKTMALKERLFGPLV